jgi:hypothetical protein
MNRQLGVMTIVLLVSLFLMIPAGSAASRTLTEDTALPIQGWTVGMEVKFKGGTVVELNDIGEVISGTLAKDVRLSPVGWKKVMYAMTYINDSYLGDINTFYRPEENDILYKKETRVVFNQRGEVIEGTLADHSAVKLRDEAHGYVYYRRDTVLRFYDNGMVAFGTLRGDYLLRPVGWQNYLARNGMAGYVKFQEKTEIAFDANGLVTAGTLKEDTRLNAAGGTARIYPKGTKVRFNENGEVI